ncbi:hypothetical protein ACFL27_15845 [candidate division CSSED10-310 bacterium]|uniref:Uncharacterized protein n=1 Tax=candidate division CSSED10-310 bacterium TaxID=2855610 RepID=A0ABV6YZQ7_UNCC1
MEQSSPPFCFFPFTILIIVRIYHDKKQAIIPLLGTLFLLVVIISILIGWWYVPHFDTLYNMIMSVGSGEISSPWSFGNPTELGTMFH